MNARNRTRTPATLLAVALLLGTAGCARASTAPPTAADAAVVAAGTARATTPVGHDADAEALAAARAAWAAAGIRNYELLVRRMCFCLDIAAVRVVVKDGRPVSLTVVDDQQPVPNPTPPRNTPATVEALFDRVVLERSISERLDVTYDKATGVPLRIYADRMVRAIDDEQTVTVAFTRTP